ncbi:34947_t:CDS:2 [Racocetra persica]|uniref:34947_t:CDS:1 n=1 Tax=Racocetra persica TaxID=160502 RepID=A0ACA9LH08_9GLOM|nr:34947_t:CDS:2 [Racocetra persica]
MDYSSVFKNLAKEAGVNIPSSAFSKPILSRQTTTSTNIKVSKCGKCGEPRSAIGWCKPCDTNKLKSQFDKWTSGNEDLDTFIRETQLNANTPYDYMRWIPFESFTNIEYVARGGMGVVFSANSENWGKVALKFLDNSENLAKDFLDELRSYHRCSLGSGIVDCYGVSKDPKTGSYVMVMRYAEQGNLRNYLSKYFTDLTWDEKIVLFDRIGKALKGIHDSGYVAAMLRCWDCEPSKRPTIDELLSMSYKWRYLSDGKAPFQGPKTKKVKSGHVKSVLTNSNTVHPQAFYTSRLLHYPNLPEPRNSDHYTLFDSTTGEIHTIVRKQNSKKDSDRSSFVPDELSSFAPSDKGKEKAQEEYRPRATRRESITRSMTLNSKIDKDAIERIRSERKKLSHYRWNSTINDIPRQVELLRIDGNFESQNS